MTAISGYVCSTVGIQPRSCKTTSEVPITPPRCLLSLNLRWWPQNLQVVGLKPTEGHRMTSFFTRKTRCFSSISKSSFHPFFILQTSKKKKPARTPPDVFSSFRNTAKFLRNYRWLRDSCLEIVLRTVRWNSCRPPMNVGLRYGRHLGEKNKQTKYEITPPMRFTANNTRTSCSSTNCVWTFWLWRCLFLSDH